ncbi:MAG: hypothetical protein FWC78_08480 [Defluviitaleaceae bacterium]|nr:hypothetical protein [Defluviitaleaceae bacterium]
MASIVNASAALRIRSEQNRAICSISGVNPNMTAEAAAGFVMGIQNMYNRGKVTARIHVVSDIEIPGNQA